VVVVVAAITSLCLDYHCYVVLVALALRFMSPGSSYSEAARRFVSDVVNVRAIGTHFKPKIEAWSTAHEIVSITPEQVRH